MLDDRTIWRILRMLHAARLSQREIARMTGISRASVSAIAHGRIRLRKRYGRRRWVANAPITYARCPGCGVKVVQPCLACFLRETLADIESVDKKGQ